MQNCVLSTTMTKIGIIGASGFTGAELLRLAAGHPDFEVAVATAATQAGVGIADLYPSLRPVYGERQFTAFDPATDAESLSGLDLVFLGLPHGASQSIVPEIRGKVGHIVDLAADFRLDDAALYPQWYGEDHRAPELLPEFQFGLPEFFRPKLEGAELIAAPGCYVTTAALTLGPLVAAGLVESSGIIVDAASGVSGAGRNPKLSNSFATVDENFAAYSLLNHRHTPEIEMAIGHHVGHDVQVLFTPHLAPMNRGILATCYARPIRSVTTDDLLACLREAYDHEPFVTVTTDSPATKATLGSNSAHVTAMADDRTGWVVAIGALDNLVKGASGQAVQCANLALGLVETTGLTSLGLYP